MKKVFEFLEDYTALILALAIGALPFWLLYKILAGIYHLLSKAIDKI